MRKIFSIASAFALIFLVSGASRADAANDCLFNFNADGAIHLAADCVTDQTINLPGNTSYVSDGNVIRATDPPGGHFVGALIDVRTGDWVSFNGFQFLGSNFSNVCDTGDDRLAGIRVVGLDVILTNNNIQGIHQDSSGCQEGNAIEICNVGGARRIVALLDNNTVNGYQKSGIMINGNVDVELVNNTIGQSATQDYLAANGIQLGFGAGGLIQQNKIAGNSWKYADTAATSVLLFQCAPTTLRNNTTMEGNSDVARFVSCAGVTLNNEKLFDIGEDGYYDYGILSLAGDTVVTKTKISGFKIPSAGVTGGKGFIKVIPSPMD